eukprot:13613705-Alexandrium_andersonii.AAC.1
MTNGLYQPPVLGHFGRRVPPRSFESPSRPKPEWALVESTTGRALSIVFGDRKAIADAFADVGHMGLRVPKPEEVGPEPPGAAVAFAMEPSSIQRFAVLAAARLPGNTVASGGADDTDVESGRERGPTQGDSKVGELGEQVDAESPHGKHLGGTRFRIGDGWVVHHRAWRCN